MLTAYNSWANQKLVTSVLDAGEEKGLFPQQSSFHTICLTVLHIGDAQEIWMCRLQGDSPQGRPGGAFNGNTEAACRLLLESSLKLENYVSRLEDAAMSRIIGYRNIKGDSIKVLFSKYSRML